MNIVLLDASEPSPSGDLTLSDHRARHLLKILKVKPGSSVRVGIVDGAQGRAEVTNIEGQRVQLRCVLDQPTPPPGADTLLLAFARPKVLLRCLEHATALGFGRIILFRSRRVEKSHLSSHAIEPATIDAHLRRGLEQARRTHRPEVLLVERFRTLIEQRLEQWVPSSNRFLADADAPVEAALAPVSAQPLSLVIGPEGGLIEHELSEFAARGFQPVRAGREPLRVETALSYLSGQLRAARSQREARAQAEGRAHEA
ncbi:MAG TPA: RsmE family RNA methyltransferase [Polyangiaceae bacterium]|nr:RsmE family RNA methyltransferase [Polyangiaceae bacterium]